MRLTHVLPDAIQLTIIRRPRKCLDFKTPFEVFFEHSVALQS